MQRRRKKHPAGFRGGLWGCSKTCGTIRGDGLEVALLVRTLTGLIPAERAFSGLSNPVVITVAAVLLVSRGLQNSGVVDLIGQPLGRLKGGVTVQVAAVTGLVMGPGGYKFGDTWRMVLPLEIIVVLVSLLLILLAWPLGV